MSSSYTVKTESRVLSIADAETAERLSKKGHKVTAKVSDQ